MKSRGRHAGRLNRSGRIAQCVSDRSLEFDRKLFEAAVSDCDIAVGTRGCNGLEMLLVKVYFLPIWSSTGTTRRGSGIEEEPSPET